MKLKLVEQSESDLNRQIRMLLMWHKARRKLTFKRINISPVIRTVRGKDIYSKNEMKGMLDWIVFIDGGVTLHIESKKKSGRVSVEQNEWMSELQKLGHFAYVVRDIGKFTEILHTHGVYDSEPLKLAERLT